VKSIIKQAVAVARDTRKRVIVAKDNDKKTVMLNAKASTTRLVQNGIKGHKMIAIAIPNGSIIYLTLCLLLTGCMGQMIPTNQKQTAANIVKAQNETREKTDIEKVIEGEPTPVNHSTVSPTVNVSGSSNRVEMKFDAEPLPPLPLPAEREGTREPYRQSYKVRHNSAESNHVDESSSFSSSTKIPLSVALLCFAIGLTILMALAWFALSRSRALNTLAKVTDDWFAETIRKHRSNAITATNTADIARNMEMVADLEAARARLVK